MVFPVIIAVMFFGGMMWDHLQRKRLSRLGETAAAKVIDVEVTRITRSKDVSETDWEKMYRFIHERRYIYTLHYTVNGTEYTNRCESEGEEPRYAAGESLDVVYNPDNPKDMRLASEMGDMGPRSMLHFILIGAVMLAVIIISALR